MATPEPRRVEVDGRTLTVRLNMANVLTATRWHRALLAAHGITNIMGAGSEKFMAALVGEGALSSIEAEAVMACACLAENKPEIGLDEYIALADGHPDLPAAIEAEVADFIRRRPNMVGPLALWHQAVVAALTAATGIDMEKVRALVTGPTGGPGSEPSPSLTLDSQTPSSGALLSES